MRRTILGLSILILSAASLTAQEAYLEYVKFTEGLCPMLDAASGDYGYIDKKGEWVIKPAWDEARNFSDGLAFVRATPGDTPFPPLSFIDAKGRVVLDLSKYVDIEGNGFSGGFAIATCDPALEPKTYAIIDTKGNRVASFVADRADSGFSDGLSPVAVGGKMGYVDPTGKFAIPPVLSSGMEFSEGLAVVSPDGRESSYIDTKGDRPFELAPEICWISSFSSGFAITLWISEDDGVYHEAVIDKTGKARRDIIGPKDGSWSFDDGSIKGGLLPIIARGTAGDYLFGFVDTKTMKVAIPPIFDAVGEPSEGLIAVISEYKIGFIDAKGRWAIRPSFVASTDYLRWGYVDETGKVLGPRDR